MYTEFWVKFTLWLIEFIRFFLWFSLMCRNPNELSSASFAALCPSWDKEDERESVCSLVLVLSWRKTRSQSGFSIVCKRGWIYHDCSVQCSFHSLERQKLFAFLWFTTYTDSLVALPMSCFTNILFTNILSWFLC